MVGMWNLSAVKLRRGPNVEPSLGAGGRLYCDWILDANGGSKEFTWEKGWRKKKPRSVHGMGWAFSEVYSGLAQLYIQRPYLAQAWMGHECQAQAHPFIQSARAKLGFFYELYHVWAFLWLFWTLCKFSSFAGFGLPNACCNPSPIIKWDQIIGPLRKMEARFKLHFV